MLLPVYVQGHANSVNGKDVIKFKAEGENGDPLMHQSPKAPALACGCIHLLLPDAVQSGTLCIFSNASP